MRAQQVEDLGEIEDQSGDLIALRNTLRGDLPGYSALTPWRSYLAIAIQWLVIAAACAIAIQSDNALVYLLAIIVIGTRQHALGVLGHEGSHYRLSRHRGLNNFVADFFCWLPLSFNNTRYGYEHLLHHRFINTDKDPYLADFKTDPQFWWPKPRKSAWWSFFQDLSGLHVARVFIKGNRWGPFYRKGVALTMADKATATVFFAMLLGGLWITKGWWLFLLLWILPLLTFTWWLTHYRTVAEHLGIPNVGEGLAGTRHVDGTWLEHLTLSPCNINYHLAHHLFPSVPWYNLPALHRRLLREPAYNNSALIRARYFGPDSVWREVVSN